MILKQWARGRDFKEFADFFSRSWAELESISEDVLSARKDILHEETQLAFNLQSRICETRRWEWPWAMLQAIERGTNQTRGTVLDIGCAYRPFTIWLRESGFDVTGIDNMSWKVKEDLSFLLGEHDIKFVNADAAKLPFSSNTFDYTFCVSVLEHCDSSVIPQIIAEGRRVTKSDGLFIITMDACGVEKSLLPEEPVPRDVIRTRQLLEEATVPWDTQGKPYVGGDSVVGIVFNGD